MRILGLNAWHPDAAACLLIDGRIVAAAEEERFNRVKHSAGFPAASAAWCLRSAGLVPGDLDHVAVSTRALEHIRGNIMYVLSGRPAYGRTIKRRLQQVARVRDHRTILAHALGVSPDAFRATFHEVEHHLAHMASAFYPTALESAALCTMDIFGDFASCLTGFGEGRRIEIQDRVLFPDSLGALYLAATQFLGWKEVGDDGKTMGLSAYGRPTFLPRMRELVHLDDDGLFRLEPEYFIHPLHGLEMVWEDRRAWVEDLFSEAFIEAFGPPRSRYAEVTQHHRDIAASVQALLEECLDHVFRHLAARTGAEDLCYAGSVATNSVANGRVRRLGAFRRIFVPPAAADSGTAVGAALHVHHGILEAPRGEPGWDVFTGPAYTEEEVETALREAGVSFERVEDVADSVAERIAQGGVVGWFQGRMEFGPRALGARSILADPRRVETRELISSRVKHRQSYRPFAASILEERAEAWFEGSHPSPYMLFVFEVRADHVGRIPAVTHEDGTCRVHTVRREHAPLYHRLLSAFEARTGVPILLNTSFNENEPMVCTPQEAVDCFLATRMDALAIGPFLVRR